MTAGFDLRLSGRQAEIQGSLHAAARDLRVLAAGAERDGLDLHTLERYLDTAGITPATLLDRGLEDPHTLLVAVEELAYGDSGIAWAAVAAFQVVTVLDACGTDEQRDGARGVLATEKPVPASVLLYEDFGRQPSEFETRVTSTGNGSTVNGHKSSVSHPGGAGISLLVGRDGEELAAFCFAGARPGLIVERDDRKAGKLAITAVPSGPVAVDGLALSAEERLSGGLELHRAVGQARLLLAACLIGLARASLEFCSAYAVHRTTWGKPLTEHQGVSFPLIEHATELAEVRLLLWDVAARIPQLTDAAAIERNVGRAVNRASSLGLRATRDGVQLTGVRAITRDLPAERWYRSAAVLGAIDFDVLQTPYGLN